jgi:7-cyano-7-deazaguanine synthase
MDLVAGMSQTDYSGYPDCRREFVDSAETTLALAMAPYRVKIHTPLMHLDKADTFKLAADLGILEIILEHTHTDYNGDRTHRHPWGYGQLDNPASRLRAQGWDEYLRRYPKDARGGE